MNHADRGDDRLTLGFLNRKLSASMPHKRVAAKHLADTLAHTQRFTQLCVGDHTLNRKVKVHYSV